MLNKREEEEWAVEMHVRKIKKDPTRASHHAVAYLFASDDDFNDVPPVEAPEGTEARYMLPPANNSTSTVGLPRESRISRARTFSITVMVITRQAKQDDDDERRYCDVGVVVFGGAARCESLNLLFASGSRFCVELPPGTKQRLSLLVHVAAPV